MPTVKFTPQLERFLAAPQAEARGATVKEVLTEVFSANPRLRDYILDEQGVLRKHVTVFIDGNMIKDRDDLSDPVEASSEVFVLQALSGG